MTIVYVFRGLRNNRIIVSFSETFIKRSSKSPDTCRRGLLEQNKDRTLSFSINIF